MGNFIPKLATVSAVIFIYLSANSVLAASTSTNWWEEDIKQDKIEDTEHVTVNTDTFQTTNDSVFENPLEFLSIGDSAIELNDESENETLFERELRTWPYNLLSYDRGTDPEADFLISMATVCGIIFIIGLIILLIRFFKLRKFRSQLLHR